MTPGRYLRLRRLAAGRGLDDLPLPGMSVLAIERDVRAPTDIELQALTWGFPFDLQVFLAISRGERPRVCRACGCSQLDACVEEIAVGVQAPCAWAGTDLCSACVEATRAPKGLTA